MGVPDRCGRSPVEGSGNPETGNQGFSERGSGCLRIAPVTCGFRDCKRALSVVFFGCLDVFCDHKVPK